MPRVKKCKDPTLARLALGLGQELYKIADASHALREHKRISDDLFCYPVHAQRELEQLDSKTRAAIMSGRRGDGSIFYLNCCCLTDRLTVDIHDYTYRRYMIRGVFGDAMDQARYVATIKKLIEICLQNPYTGALSLGNQLRDWARLFLPSDPAYAELPETIGRLTANGRCGEYVYLLAVGEDEEARKIANSDAADMCPTERIETEARSIEWLWHENDFDGALERFYKLWPENTTGVQGWDSVDDLVSRLWLLKGFADTLDSILVRDLALSLYVSLLQVALSFRSLPRALSVGQDHPGLRAVTAALANAVSVCLIHRDRHADADVTCSWALKERMSLRNDEAHPNLVKEEDLAKTLNNKGVCLDLLSRPDESLPYLTQALEIRSDMYHQGASQGDHYYAMSRNALGVHFFRLARTYAEKGDLQLAKHEFEEALKQHEEAGKVRAAKKNDARWSPRYAASLRNMAGCHMELADICKASGDAGEAEHLACARSLLWESLEIRLACFRDYPHIYRGGIIDSYNKLVEVSERLGVSDLPDVSLENVNSVAGAKLDEATCRAARELAELGFPTKAEDIESVTNSVLAAIRLLAQEDSNCS